MLTFTLTSVRLYFFGSVCALFDLNTAASTLLGMLSGSTKGDGLKQTVQAREVLALISRGLSEKLNNAIWSAVRNDRSALATFDISKTAIIIS